MVLQNTNIIKNFKNNFTQYEMLSMQDSGTANKNP